jgi:myo-inositol-1(or 4)-monophosphatase
LNASAQDKRSDVPEGLWPAVLEAGKGAAAYLMTGYRTRPRATSKGVIDFVTEFDLGSEARLLEALRPWGIPIVAEESAKAGLQAPDPAQGLSLHLDPLDGTTNYVHGHPFFAVSIGLLCGDEAIAGLVVAPALGVTWRCDPAPEPLALRNALRNDVACCVSPTAALGEALLSTGFPYDRQTSPDNNFAEFVALKRIARGVRRCGSAAIDLCLVADGTYDGYWERKLNSWDLVAGAAMVRAAGGALSSFAGAAADLRSGAVVATNGRLHDALVRELARASEAQSGELRERSQ